jgi:hypothetical protein
MADGVEFSFRITGTGWAAVRIGVGGSVATPTASYLSDALGDLIRAVRALLEGAKEARASWEEEPGEYRWILQREASQVRITLLDFRDIYDESPDEDGEVLLDATCGLSELGLAVGSAARRLLDEVGSQGYGEMDRASIPERRPSGTGAACRTHLRLNLLRER